jgi:hypothetical protein
MFFSLSKILGFFVVPSNTVAILCALGALLLLTRFRKAGSRILAFGMFLLLVCGYSSLGNLLMLPLTERFPAWSAAGRTPDGIIVLGGSIDPERSQARGSLEIDASAERIVTMLQLARRYPQARIVFSGGSANLIQEPVSEAPIAGDLLQDFGTPASRIVLEGFPHHRRECGIYAQAGVAEAGRAVAARNVRVPHAALNRCVQKSWIRYRGLPGGLAHARLERCFDAVHSVERGPRSHRCRRS